MDRWFDELARVAGAPLPRRRALRLLIAGAAGLGAAALGVRPAAATCYGVCDHNNVCKGGSCTQGTTCPCQGRAPGDSCAC